MIMFLFTMVILTALFAGLFILVKQRMVSIYRGGVFIILSGLYFSAVFVIAHLMRESFK